jgi:DNA recombination protein RmuC
MESILLIAVIALAGAVLYMVARKPSGPTAEETNAQFQALLQQSAQQQLATILQQLNQQQTLQQGHSSQLHARLSETGQAVSQLQAKLTSLEEGNKRILDMSRGITELQNILQAPKLRGEHGEMWLEELLAQMIPREHFKIQHRFKSGEICDAAILLRDNLILPIDSKFSLENFRKMASAEDAAEAKVHEKVFISDVKRRIDEIAKKYILPGEGTLSFAFMYVPAENVYYQAFVEDRSNNALQRYAFDKHVIPVSPNSLYPYLEIVLFGLRGMEIEKGARDIQQSIVGLQGDIGRFEEDYKKIGFHLKNAQNSFEISDKRLGVVQGKLSTIGAKQLEEVVNVPEL